MDLSGVPKDAIRVVTETDLDYVDAEGQPPLVLTAAQLQYLWTQALQGRERDAVRPRRVTGRP